ncbi:trypsin-like peptidase domain-containing protein [Micromonospora sp. H33]|uniref:trypsin-like peptidase domain-containing protein n=1 Tax=Micromonospora sp. H33 TaxID=3452215 RepID=UPI003F89CDC4
MSDGCVLAGAKVRGCGFLLTERTVLTAAHVVRDRRVDELAFVTETGRRVDVAAVRAVPEIDAATLTLAEPAPDPPMRVGGPAAPGAPWRVTARPEPASVQLTGTVSAVDHRVVNAQRHEMVVLQLAVAEELGEYQGYSGAAVTVDGAVVGVLVEQVRERITASGARRASNVLYAVPVGDVLDHLGLHRPVQAPVGWREDLRRLLDELAEDPDLPDELCRPETVAVQAYAVLAAALSGGSATDPERLADRIRRQARRSAAEEPVYRLAAATPLTAGSLRSMLDRLARVHATAAALPTHLRRPRYLIEAPGTVLADPVAEIDRWLAARLADVGDDDRYDVEETLRGMRDRLDPPMFDRDPAGEVIALLNNAGWDAPARTAERLVREVFTRGADAADLEAGLERILTRGAPTEVTALTAAHRQPATVTRDDHGYLVNRQPTLYHLEHGYFAATDVLDEFERAYWSWYEQAVVESARTGRSVVPMFWITGPSGAGKSVLLLQLLARLNARSGVSVLLPPAGTRLSRATRWAGELSPARHVVVGVDDPLSWTEDDGRAAWPEVFHALAHRRQTGSTLDLPVFVCCAPTEHRAEFVAEYRRHVLVGGMALDPYRPEFTEQLRTWYTARTGAAPPPVPRRGVPLPAQLFLEWRSGEGIEEYAERFQRRITSQGLPELADFFAHLLAVNRLYVGYPQEAVDALSEETRQAFAAYREDMHVQLSGEGGRPGYWFAHPHVADLMYEVWFPPGTREPERTAHLRDALLEALAAVPRGWAAVPLLRRLRSAAGGGAGPAAGERDVAAARAPQASVRSALADVADRLGPELADLASPVLAEWIRIEHQVWPSRSDRRPRECAIVRLDGPPDQGMDELLRALVELDNPGVDAEVWAYLQRHLEWEGWLTVAGPLVRRRALSRDVDLLAQVIETTLARQPAAAMLLADVLETAADNGPLVRLAHRLVTGELPVDAPLAPVVAALYRRDRNRMRGRSPLAAPIHRGLVRDWLAADPRPEHRTVYEEVLTGPVPPMLRPALEAWVRAFPAERLAGTALAQWVDRPWLDGEERRELLHTHLERCDDVDPRLAGKVRHLLSHDGRGWARLFTLLPETWVRDPQVRVAALTWLRGQRAPAAWHWVYTHLCRSTGEPDDELRRLGAGHLTACGEEHSCVYTRYWLLQVTAAPGRPGAARDTFRWLRDRPGLTAAWWLLAGQILRAAPPDDADEVVDVFVTWVRDHPDDGAAGHVLSASLAAETSPAVRRRLLACVEEWLSAPRPGWARTYAAARPLLDVDRGAALALPWLLRSADDKGWLRVFFATVDQLDAAQLATVVRAWFATAGSTAFAARPLWRVAVEEGPCAALVRDPSFRAVVVAWLARGGGTAAWRPITLSLVAADPADPAPLRVVLTGGIPLHSVYGFADDLEELLRTRPDVAGSMRRLLAAVDRTPAWRIVWRRLLSVEPDDHGWQVSLALLPEEPPDAFAPLWVRLWDAYPDDDRRDALRALAERRLAGQPVDDPVWRHVRRKLASGLAEGDPAPDPEPVVGVGVPLPSLPAPRAGDGTSAPWQCRLECPHCGVPFDVTSGDGTRQARWTCLRCDHDLTIDTETLAMTARRMTRTAGRLVSVAGRAPRWRPRVHCDRCGRGIVANVPAPEGGHVAVDRQCRRLYEVTAAEVTDFVEHARYVEAGRTAEGRGPAT